MKKFLSLVLALVMVMSLVTVSAGAKDFTDDSKINYEEAVDVMSALKVIDGYPDGSFAPQGSLTRGAAAKIICNLILGPTTASALSADTAPYKDVPVNHTFAGYIAYCQEQGIISGYADGSFRPGATLTNYAFLKMLLGALGYNAEIEGYVGDNWSIAVAKQALHVGLTKGLDGDLNGTDYATREQACLYALNTLKATMVDYEAKITANVNGAQVIVGNSVANDVKWNIASKTDGNIKDDDYVQFAEKYFKNLELEVGNGIYGRPANTWKLKKSEIGTYTTIDPTYVYTEGTESQDVYKDLGKVLCDPKGDYDWTVFVNGKEVAAKEIVLPEKSNDDDYVYTGSGTVTEVYVDEDAETVTVCAINYYLGQVTKVKSDDDGEYININVLSKEPKLNDKTFYVEGYSEDDYVVFTVDFNDDDEYVIGEVCEPETVSGDVARVELDKDKDVVDPEYGKTYLKIDGSKYTYSAVGHIVYDLDDVNTKAHPALNEDYTLYMDPNGFVLAFEKTEEDADQYLYVKDSDEELKDWIAKVVLIDATSAKVDVKDELKKVPTDFPGYVAKDKTADIVWLDKTGAAVDDEQDAKIKTNIDERVWKYSASDKGVYTLTWVDQVELGTPKVKDEYTAEIHNGKAYITDGGNDYIVDKKTVFVDVDGGKAYTGYNEVPNVENAHLIVVGGKVADVVFILDGDIYDENSTYFVLEKDTRESLKYDGDYYWDYSKAYVDGVKQNVIVDYDAFGGSKLAKVTWDNKTVYKATKTVDEQYISEVVEAVAKKEGVPTAVGDDAFWITSTKNQKYKFDTDEETVFVTVEFDEKGKLDSIYDGDIKDMDLDADDYDVYVKVLKASDDDEHADLVYIFIMEKGEVVVPGLGGSDEWAKITNTSSSDLTAEIVGVDMVGTGYSALELCKRAMEDAGYTYKYTDADGKLIGMMGDRIYTFTDKLSKAYEVTLTEKDANVSITSETKAYVVKDTKLTVTLENENDWAQQGEDKYTVTASGFTASGVKTEGKIMTVTLTCDADLSKDTAVELTWAVK